jgi:phage tail-like protein
MPVLDGTHIGMANRFQVKVLAPSEFDLGTWAKCDGLDVQWTVNSYQAGDQGNALWLFPGGTKYKDITLQRVACEHTKVIKDQWLKKTSFEHVKHHIVITLLDESYDMANSVCDWDLIDAMPKQWSISGFEASKSAVAIETLVIAHTGFLDDLKSVWP